MKVGFFTKYDEQGASSRVRAFAYRDRLQAQGVECHFAPLLDRQYLARMYRNEAPILLDAVASSWRRLTQLAKSSRYDALWFEYELFPYAPAVFERLIGLSPLPYVADYDDAIFHHYDLNRHAIIRNGLRRKIDVVMRNASAVTVANEYLATHAAAAGAKRIVRLPTVIDLARFPDHGAQRQPGPVRVGWIGTPNTVRFLGMVRDPLGRLAAKVPLEIRVIGAEASPLGDLPVTHVPWQEATEVKELAAFDIGIMPLPDTPWTRGKSAYKLLQCMAAGKPVVGSPVGMNATVVEDGRNGYLPANADEWLEALGKLATDEAARVRMGAEGRAMVAKSYTYDQTTPIVLELLTSIAAGRRGAS